MLKLYNHYLSGEFHNSPEEKKSLSINKMKFQEFLNSLKEYNFDFGDDLDQLLTKEFAYLKNYKDLKNEIDTIQTKYKELNHNCSLEEFSIVCIFTYCDYVKNINRNYQMSTEFNYPINEYYFYELYQRYLKGEFGSHDIDDRVPSFTNKKIPDDLLAELGLPEKFPTDNPMIGKKLFMKTCVLKCKNDYYEHLTHFWDYENIGYGIVERYTDLRTPKDFFILCVWLFYKNRPESGFTEVNI